MTAASVAFRAGSTGGGAGITQDAADSATNWTGGALDTDSEIQNTGCIGAKVSNATVLMWHAGTSRDFVGVGAANEGDHVYTWLNCLTPNLDTIANGGLRVQVGQDAATNFREFYVGGDGTAADDSYKGGWKCFVVDPTLSADASRILDTGTPDMNIADSFGATIKTVAMISGNFNNGLVDAIRIGTGLRLINGTGLDPDGDFADFVSADEGTKANRYGVIRNVGGVNLVQGKLFFGDGTTTTEFTDTNALVVFEEANVATTFYELYIDTDSTVTFGAISSGVTSGGCFFDSEDTTHAYALTVVEGGTVEAVLNAYATTFNEYRVATLNPSTTMQDSIFSNGGQITLNGATLTDCSILSSTVGANTGALLVDSVTEWNGSGTAVVSGTFFGDNAANANSGAIEITAASATAYEFDNITFSGNSYDVINSSGGAITINVNGGDTPSVLNLTTSSTTINNAVTVEATGLTEGAAAKFIANETVGTVTKGDVLQEMLANSSGVASFSQNYEAAFNPSGLDIILRVAQNGLPNAAIADDGGSQTDETTASNSTTSDDMTLMPDTTQAINDAYYFGHSEQFTNGPNGKIRLKLEVTTAHGAGNPTIVWEFWNGLSWASLTFTGSDPNANWTSTGTFIYEWDAEGSWSTTTVNSQGPFYYVRARVSVAGTSTNGANGRFCTLDVTKYFRQDLERTISSTGLSTVVPWNENTLAKFDPLND